MIRLPKGTLEALYVIVKDRLETITTLDGTTVTYEIRDNSTDVDDDTAIETGPCTNDGMTAITQPIDTSNYEEGKYHLFIYIEIDTETIKLGPFVFVIG